MQLQQIKYFLVLREELNFTRAAQRCGVSQPTLTGCIKRLEAELGGLLFARRRKISLTRLGRAMAPYFERIVQDAQDALDAAHALRSNAIDQGKTAGRSEARVA
jgi:LysR family transcriptional regulator, hydrogen peroxide-inducible genes activator